MEKETFTTEKDIFSVGKWNGIEYTEEDIDNMIDNFERLSSEDKNYKVPFKINRDILFQLLKKEKIKCRYDPNSHACVNIRYDINASDKVSIFVFQSGSIIITGGKTILDINKGYHYIMNIISTHYETIKKKDLDDYINSLDIDNEENDNIISLSNANN